MPIEYSEGQPRLKDSRIEKALEWLSTYQETLRKVFNGLPDESKQALVSIPNPHLATGPMQILVCTNGVVAIIKNGLASSAITAEVVLSDVLNMTMVEYFNSKTEQFFTFMEPISKLSSKGNTVTFADRSTYEGQLVMVIIADREDRMWLPPASKVFLMGWRFFEDGDPQLKAQEAAKQNVANAYGLVNLRSKGAAGRLLEDYRALLVSATNEAALQRFLEAHPEFIYPEHDLALPKPTLGGERQPDFAFSIRSSTGSQWTFVEIERSDKRVFTTGQDFQFTHEFTQAKGQLLQWDTLITKDLGFFERRFPGLLKPDFHLIFGRDSELDTSRREMLVAEFSASPNRRFSTFDDLANRFETIISRIFPTVSD